MLLVCNLAGICLLAGCAKPEPIESAAPEKIEVIVVPGPIGYGDCLTQEERQRSFSLHQEGVALLSDPKTAARPGDLMRGLELLRQSWEMTACADGWLDELYGRYGSKQAAKGRYRDVGRWFARWGKTYKERAEHGDLLDQMRYYFWPANGMDEQEQIEYYDRLRKLYTERTGKDAPLEDWRC